MSVPDPALIRLVAPTPFCMTPEKVVLALFVPVVRAALDAPEFVTMPSPARAPMFCAKPPRSSVAPDETV